MEKDVNNGSDNCALLEKKQRKKSTPEREEYDEKAYAFYTGLVIMEARINNKISQGELAKRLGVDKSYVSKIENGNVNPSVGFFYRIMKALNLKIDITEQVD